MSKKETEKPVASAHKRSGRPTVFEIAAGATLLKEHCRKVNGEAIYDPGWNDARVAKESGMPFTWVAPTRNKHFGNLPERGVNPAPVHILRDLEKRIEALEAEVKANSTDTASVLRWIFREFSQRVQGARTPRDIIVANSEGESA